MAQKTTNEVVLEGRLVRDPEMRFTQKGLAITNFTIATDDGTVEKPKSNFHAVKSFGNLAEEIGEKFSKGDTVLVRGRLDNEEWDDKETGKKRSKTVVIVGSFYKKVWGKRKPAGDEPQIRSQNDNRAALQQQDDPASEADDAVPF